MNRVLVTYGWVRSSYAAVRNLTEHGVDVIASDINRVGMCQWSKYPMGKLRYTSHYEDEEQFIEDLKKICLDQDIDLILGSHNETEVLARHRNEFPESVGALLPNTEHCALFNNKARAYELARECGVPVPTRLDYDEPEDLAIQVKENGSQRFVVKLLSGNSAKGIFYANGAEETEALAKRLIEEFELPQDRYPQVESFVDGEGWGCSSLFWEGKPIASFCHRRLREKTLTGGTSTYRVAEQNERLIEYSNKLLSSIGWHGLAMVEYKVNPSTGEIWFIEVNPRMWGSIHLPIAAGYEFPYLAWLCATKGPEAAVEYHENTAKRDGIKARWLLGDIIVSVQQLSRGRFTEAFKTLFLQSADTIDDWNWRDPFAFLGELAHYGNTFIRKRSTNPVEKGMIG